MEHLTSKCSRVRDTLDKVKPSLIRQDTSRTRLLSATTASYLRLSLLASGWPEKWRFSLVAEGEDGKKTMEEVGRVWKLQQRRWR